VRTGDLASRGDGVVVDAPPRRDLTRDASLDRHVVTERDRKDGEGVLEVVESDADKLAGRVDDRPDIRVLAVPALPEELDGDVHEVLRGMREGKSHDPARAEEPLVVLAEVQPVELLLVGVPVRPDPFKDTRAVVEGMGHDADLRLADRNELPTQVRPGGVGRSSL